MRISADIHNRKKCGLDMKILRADINSDSDRDFEKLADMDMDTNISLNSYMDIYISTYE